MTSPDPRGPATPLSAASEALRRRARELAGDPLPFPGGGETHIRHLRLIAAGEEDLSLAKLIEAHWDAVAILHEAGRSPVPGCLYAVWASEAPGQSLELRPDNTLWGTKRFATGLDLIDRALVTVNVPSAPAPEQPAAAATRLLELDLRAAAPWSTSALDSWHTPAFAATRTGALTFNGLPIRDELWVGQPGFYLDRPGFWHGALGPAACWAGGAAGLLRFALATRRSDPHTRAHLGAMAANQWSLRALLLEAGREIDQASLPPHPTHPADIAAPPLTPMQRALAVRHAVETLCSDTLDRFARALGPVPLALAPDISRRFAELQLFLRQSHAERDLEALGNALVSSARHP